jgi:hypothetical protein
MSHTTRSYMYRLGPFRILGALLAFYGVNMPRNPKNNHSLWRDLGHFAIGTLTCKLVNLLSKLSQEFVWSTQRKPHKNCSTLSKTLFSLHLFKFRTRKTPITLQRLPLQPPIQKSSSSDRLMTSFAYMISTNAQVVISQFHTFETAHNWQNYQLISSSRWSD